MFRFSDYMLDITPTGYSFERTYTTPEGIDFDAPSYRFTLRFTWFDRLQQWWVVPVATDGSLLGAPILASPGAYFIWSAASGPLARTHRLMFTGDLWGDIPRTRLGIDLQLGFIPGTSF